MSRVGLQTGSINAVRSARILREWYEAGEREHFGLKFQYVLEQDRSNIVENGRHLPPLTALGQTAEEVLNGIASEKTEIDRFGLDVGYWDLIGFSRQTAVSAKIKINEEYELTQMGDDGDVTNISFEYCAASIMHVEIQQCLFKHLECLATKPSSSTNIHIAFLYQWATDPKFDLRFIKNEDNQTFNARLSDTTTCQFGFAAFVDKTFNYADMVENGDTKCRVSAS